MSFPSTQTRVARELTHWVNKKYDTNISLGTFRYTFPENFTLQDLYALDDEGDTLIYTHMLEFDFRSYNRATKSLDVGDIEVEQLRLNWLVKKGDSIPGFKRFTDKFKTGSTTSSALFSMEANSIEIADGIFRRENLNCNSCQRLWLTDLDIQVDDFELNGTYVEGDVREMRVKDKYSLSIESFEGYFGYLKEEMIFRDVELKTPDSFIKGNMVFQYDQTTDLSDFVNKVRMEAELEENTSIRSSDIQHFSPRFPDFGQFLISGKVEGMVNDLSTENVTLELADNTHLSGNIYIKDATSPEQIYIDAQQLVIRSTPKDIEKLNGLFSDTALPVQVQRLGDVNFTGNFNGTLNDFRADGILNTDVGSVKADLAFIDPKSQKDAVSYKGRVELQNVDLGRLFQDSLMGLVTTRLEVDGRGFDPVSMNTRLKGNISQFQFNGYPYSGISVNGRIEKGNFRGRLAINDPNLQFTFNGDASFGKDTSKYDFEAKLDTANLFALNLTKDSIAYVAGEMDINFTAVNYDDWEGTIKVSNTTFANERNFYFFQDIFVESEGLDTSRALTIRSNILDANIKGNYTLSGINKAFTYHIKKFVKNAKRIPPPPSENFTFDIAIKNTQILTEILMPVLSIEPNSTITGNFSEDTRELDIKIISPGFSFKKNDVRDINLYYKGSDERSELNFNIDNVTLAMGFEIDSIRLGNYYYQDTLFYNLKWVFRDSIDSRASLNGYALQNDSLNFEFGIDSSVFNIGHQNFVIRDENRIYLDTGGVHVEDLVIANRDRLLVINGNVSRNPNEILRVNLRGFGMELANYFIGSSQARFRGELYGDIIATQLLANPRFATNLKIDSLEMNNRLLGNFDLTSDWTYPDDTVNILATMNLGELQTMRLEGYYQPDSLGSINLDAKFNQFRLAAFNPFLEGVAENLRGYLEGNISITGNTGAPKVRGDLTLPKAALTIGFLQADYNLTGNPQVQILEDRIAFTDITLRDTKYATTGILRGKVTHENFRNFKLDLTVDADELLVLDTEASTEDQYFGTAFATGKITMIGPPQEMVVKADVSTARKTRFNIPLDAATNVSKSDFVTFVNRDAQESPVAKPKNRMSIKKGISIDFNIEVDQNAEVQIIVDQQAGTKLTSYGNGNLNLKMDSYADMTLDGSYTVYEGDFLFSLQGLVRRKFEVQQGGSITWNGDPTAAIVDITARYQTRADPGVILNDYNGGKTLVYVDLHLTGELLNPNIAFDIITPRASSATQTILTNVVSSENQVNQQVFSLLLRNSFAPEANFFGGGAGGINGFDLLAQQAASWINQITGDYQVTLAYQGAGNEVASDPGATLIGSQEEVEVGISKKFFNDRVTVNSSVGVPLGENQNQIAGDFEIEYSISEDGRLRSKVFTRSIQNQFSFSEQNYQHGIGLFYRVDFNRIFKSRKQKEKEKKILEGTEEEAPEPMDNDLRD